MTSSLRFLCVFVLLSGLAGCGGKDHWAKRPTETVSGDADGVKYSIELVKGMRARPDSGAVTYDIHEDGRVFMPHITISSGDGAPKKLADYLKSEEGTPEITEELAGGGFVVAMENQYYKGKDDWLVHAEVKAGDKHLRCDARLSKFTSGDTAKDHLPTVVKFCKSLEGQ